MYLDKEVMVHINKNRKVAGTLRGYDQFMNVVLDNAAEDGNRSNNIGMVVRLMLRYVSFSFII